MPIFFNHFLLLSWPYLYLFKLHSNSEDLWNNLDVKDTEDFDMKLEDNRPLSTEEKVRQQNRIRQMAFKARQILPKDFKSFCLVAAHLIKNAHRYFKVDSSDVKREMKRELEKEMKLEITDQKEVCKGEDLHESFSSVDDKCPARQQNATYHSNLEETKSYPRTTGVSCKVEESVGFISGHF